jgi:hypothetical protein
MLQMTRHKEPEASLLSFGSEACDRAKSQHGGLFSPVAQRNGVWLSLRWARSRQRMSRLRLLLVVVGQKGGVCRCSARLLMALVRGHPCPLPGQTVSSTSDDWLSRSALQTQF